MFKTKFLAFILTIILLSGCGSTSKTEAINNTNRDKSQSPVTTEVIEPQDLDEEKDKTPAEQAPQEEEQASVSEAKKSRKPSSGKVLSWYLRPNLEHATPEVPDNIKNMLTQNNGFYVLPNKQNTVYLTFDEGYELGYTPLILDILKENNVKATFFITGHYLNSQPDLVKRMVKEGHMVANHTVNHPNLAEVSPDKLTREIMQLEEDFRNLTASDMGKYIRPPAGNYSETSLKHTQELGYTTVFWSLAFNDWDPNNQPGRDYSYQYVTDHIHPGAVILLHAVSESNTEALADILVDLQDAGYVFSLFE